MLEINNKVIFFSWLLSDLLNIILNINLRKN